VLGFLFAVALLFYIGMLAYLYDITIGNIKRRLNRRRIRQRIYKYSC
jgi:hypothetical protein